MRKRVAILLIVAILAPMCLCAGKSEDQLLALQNKAMTMSDVEKGLLFETYEKHSGLPFALNFILGAGIGSFVQGDAKGGVTCLVGDLGAGLLVGIGSGLAQMKASEGELPGALEALFVYGGLAALLGLRIYECVRPFTFAKSYNSELRKALMGDASLTVLPTMGKDAPGVAVVGSVRF